jgi:hypothetical protein
VQYFPFYQKTIELTIRTYETQDLLLTELANFAYSRKKTHVSDRTSVVNFNQHDIGQMNVLSKFGSDEQVEIELEFFTIGHESKQLSVCLLFGKTMSHVSHTLKFGHYLLKIVAQVKVLRLRMLIFKTVLAANQ